MHQCYNRLSEKQRLDAVLEAEEETGVLLYLKKMTKEMYVASTVDVEWCVFTNRLP